MKKSKRNDITKRGGEEEGNSRKPREVRRGNSLFGPVIVGREGALT